MLDAPAGRPCDVSQARCEVGILRRKGMQMAGKYDDFRVRRVVAGWDENGRSTIVSDGFTETRLVADAFILNQIWQVPHCPPKVDDENTLGAEAVIPPPA